ncbi:inner centromere protein, ARK-binding region protein [Toxoplasma gondii CAST]|uniref:Inner centromere protein, ARK-binding region protein n=1 Tax=Toxoplasma gondii CAST TaxID=943122 RepID=A0A3R8ANK4_TOXGO|nr:inner centromere protein, ARK-binding region protein [Toxoplasma gondii CAST]
MSNSLGSFLLGGLVQPLLGTLQNWTSKKRKQREDEQAGLQTAASGVACSQSGRPLGSVPAGCVLRQGGRIIPADSLPGRRERCSSGHAKDGSGWSVLPSQKSLAPAAKRRRGSAGRGQGNATGGNRRDAERNEAGDTGVLTEDDSSQSVHQWPATEQPGGQLQRSKRGRALRRKARNSAKKAPEREGIPESEFQRPLGSEALREMSSQIPGTDSASENLEAKATGHDALSSHASVSTFPSTEIREIQRKTAASLPASGHLSTSLAFARPLGFPAGSSASAAELEARPGQARGNGLCRQEGSGTVEGKVLTRITSSLSPHLSSANEHTLQNRGGYLSSAAPNLLSSPSAPSLPNSSCSVPCSTGDGERGHAQTQFSSLPSSLDPQTGEVGSRGSDPFSRLAQNCGSSISSRINGRYAETGRCCGGESGDRGVDNLWSNSKAPQMFRPLSSLSAASSSTTASVTTCASTRVVASSSRSMCFSNDTHQTISSSTLYANYEQKEGTLGEATGRGGITMETRSFAHQLQHSEQRREQMFTNDSQKDREDDKENHILLEEEDEEAGHEGKKRSEVFGHRVLRPLRSKNLHENYDALIDIVAFAKRRCEKETMELLRRDVQILYYARGLHHPTHVQTFQRQAQHPLTSGAAPQGPPPSFSSLPSVTAALAAGAHPHPCPSWATREELRAAMSRQDAFNPFTVFGEAPPELVLSEIYDQRHYTHVSAQTRASHPVIARLAASHGEAAASRDSEGDRRLQLPESRRDLMARKGIAPEEAKRLWMEALEDLQRKRDDMTERGGQVTAAFHRELVKYGFARQLDVTAFREKLLPALEAWWKGQCDIELDWRHDPLTGEECAWYAEAMHALTDATDIMTVKQLCFCPTPPPYRPWSWTDSRFRLRQKTEARRRAKELRGKRGQGAGAKESGDVNPEGEMQDWEGGQTPQASASELEGDERGRGGLSARKRSRSRARRGAGESGEQRAKQTEGAGLASAFTAGGADSSLDRTGGTGTDEKTGAFSEGSPITPQVRRGVGGQLIVITRRGALSQDQSTFPHAGPEGQSGNCDAPRGHVAKRLKPNSPRSTAAQREASSSYTSGAANSGMPGGSTGSSSQCSSASLRKKDEGDIQSGNGISGSHAASWVAAKNRVARAYPWNTPPSKKPGLRSALERRAAATAAAAAAAVAGWTGNRPLVSPDNLNRTSPGLFSGKTFCTTQWWPRHQALRGMQTSPFASSTGVSGGNAKALGLPSSVGQEARSLGQDPAGVSAPGGRSGANGAAISSSARPGQGMWTRVEQLEERGKRVYSRPLATVPRARLSIDRVYGGRHNDFVRTPYTSWPTF